MDNPSNEKDPLVFNAVMDNNTIELLRQKSWALLKADYIQTSAEHRCIRKFYILSKTKGKELDYEFLPCELYKNLTLELQQDFIFRKHHIHKLKYIPNNPRQYDVPGCVTALRKLEKFILDNNIDLILYHGGTFEKDLCMVLDIPSTDLVCKNPKMCQRSCVLTYVKKHNFHEKNYEG